MNFRDWPSKAVTEDQAGNTYVGYSPLAGARLADPVWVVERISAVGTNAFAVGCLPDGAFGPEPVEAMDDPGALQYAERAE